MTMCAWPAARRVWRSMHALRSVRRWNRMRRIHRAWLVAAVCYVPVVVLALLFPHQGGAMFWTAVGALAFGLGHVIYQYIRDVREHRQPRLSAVYFCAYCATAQPADGEGPHADWCPCNDGIPEPCPYCGKTGCVRNADGVAGDCADYARRFRKGQ